MVEDFYSVSGNTLCSKIPRIRARVLLSTEATCCFCAVVNIRQSDLVASV